MAIYFNKHEKMGTSALKEILSTYYTYYVTGLGPHVVELEFFNHITGAQETKVYKGKTNKEAWAKARRETTRRQNRCNRLYSHLMED